VAGRFQFAVAVLAVVLAAVHARSDTPLAAAPAAQAASQPRASSLDEYRAHLAHLAALVEVCAKGRDTKTCDPGLVGQDDRVLVEAGAGSEQRLVRYGWLRVLLQRAQEKGEPKPSAAAGANPKKEDVGPAEPTTGGLLEAAKARLAADLAQAGSMAAAARVHGEERDVMRQVLAGRDFRNLEAPTARDAALERLGNWLNRMFEGAAKLRLRSAWIGRLIVWGFILAVCVALAWGLIRLERRWRIRLVPASDIPAAGAPSIRDWQLWLADARKAAAAGQWREAIHCVYWGSISRLESRRLWPADRARTPREYLALVGAADPRSAGLAALTRSFERTWYGGLPASESDYRAAEAMAAAVMAGRASSIGGGN